MTQTEFSRRDFLKASVVTGGMLLTINLPAAANGKKSIAQSSQWCLYVNIDKDNRVTMHSPIAEMGQHMKTTGPMILAEELDLDWHKVQISKAAPTFLSKNASGEIGYQYADMRSGGSHAVRRNWDYLRQAGATARRMLIEEAAAVWQVSPDLLATKNSYVINTASGLRLSYGELAQGASKRKVDTAKISLKDPADFTIMGKNTRTVDIEKIVTGQPLYAIDDDYPGALQVVIHRAPAFGASVKSYNEASALKVPGVLKVVKVEANYDFPGEKHQKQVVAAGVAVVAETLWAAMQGKQRLETKWSLSSTSKVQDSEQQQSELKRLVESDNKGTIRVDHGDVEAALANAKHILDQTYETPLFAHACMEPHNCIADIRSNGATIIVSHQFPDIVAEEVERITGIDMANIEIINRRGGGGFGRRYERDFLREAIVLSKQLKQPVKITWTREDEIERDFFAPAHAMRVQAGLNEKNKLIAWSHRHAQTRGGPRDQCFPANLVDNYRTELIPFESLIPTGPWRGPGHFQWTFAVESMTDELAHYTQQDPLAYRLNMLKPFKAYDYVGFGATQIDSGRMAACYQRAAELASWGRELKPGTGLGIAGHFTFGSYAAFVIEVSVDSKNQLTLNKAWGAIDCGFAVNPNHIRNQMEGGFIEGLNAALFNSAKVKESRVTNNNFHTLRWTKMREAPIDIEAAIIENEYPPTGVGEPPTAPAAAALTNAIFAASGIRIRKLPIADTLTV